MKGLRAVQPPQAPFVLFIGGVTSNESADELYEVASYLLQAGAVYVVCWGKGAARLEEIFDEAAVMRHLAEPSPFIMTTSHEDESLEEALEFAVTAALPAEEFALTCRVVVTAMVWNVNDYNEAHNYLEDAMSDTSASNNVMNRPRDQSAS